MVHVFHILCGVYAYGKDLRRVLRWCRCRRRMSPRLKRFVQTLFVAALVAYTTLLAYQLSRAALTTTDTQVDQDTSPPISLSFLHNSSNLDQQFLYRQRNDLPVSQIIFKSHKITHPTTEPSFAPAGVAATATIRPPATSLDDLFISVKTTRHYHETRLPSILKTWFQLAKLQTWFFTDTDDAVFQRKTNGHMINTNCTSSHHRKALCCKMSVEFDTFINTNKKWFCHFDDDNYVNVPRLVRFLGDYNPRDDWYLGKTSIQAPWEIINKDKKPRQQKAKFWFATGGAGFCLSRALALKMMPVASGGKFISTGEKIRLPDDVTMGYIIEHLLKTPLTVVDQFHSHLEPMKFIRREFLQDQISFSYHIKSKDAKNWNVVKVEGFDLKNDPNRFLSLHCYLFPNFNFCPK